MITRSTLHRALLVCAAVSCSVGFGAQNILKNGSMENGLGANAPDPFAAADWTEFGQNVERSAEANLPPPDDGHALKAFGDPVNISAGAFQEYTASPGQSVTVNWSNYTRGSDKLGGSGAAGIRVEFRGFFGNILSSTEVLSFDATAPADTWVADSIGPLVAPASTAKFRVYCKLGWTDAISGSVYWDQVETLLDAVDITVNGDFETPGVTGISSTGIDDWIGFNNQVKSPDFSVDGDYSLKIGTTEQFSGLFQQMGEVTDGDHILLKAKVMHPSSNPLTGNAIAGLKLEFKSASPPNPPVENLAFNDLSPTDTWTLVEASTTGLVVPTDVTIARVVMIYNGANSSLGTIFFDSAEAHVNGSPTNALLNGSFEFGPGGANGLDNWTEFNSAGSEAVKSSLFDLAPPHAGDFTCRATGTAVAGVFQEIAVTTGDTLDVSAYLYMPSSDPLVNASAGVKVEWVGGNRPPDIDIIGNPANPVVLDASSPTDTWIDLSIDFTMPAGTSAIAQFTNLVAFAGGVTTGVAYFDNCEAIVLNRFDGADADGDDDEDLFDFGQFQRCFGDAGGIPAEPKWNCTVFDDNDDGTIDLTDYAFFAPRLTGP